MQQIGQQMAEDEGDSIIQVAEDQMFQKQEQGQTKLK